MGNYKPVKNNTISISFLRLLGQGGFGKVFLGEMTTSLGFTQRVAVKVLHSEYQQDKKILNRLIDEARMLGVLNQRNIVKVYDICQVNGQMAIIMEYIEGHSISTLLKQSPIGWAKTWQIIADCATGLSTAYSTKDSYTQIPLELIHRDVKPSNVLLSTSGTVKLLDFGIAKMNGVRESKTSTHQMGTARYMAPEQWLSNHSSSAVDVYALARTALEMLMGELLPRTPLDKNMHDQAMFEVVQNVPTTDVPHILADAGRDLLWSMLSYEPEKRLNISEVADRALGLAEAMGVTSLRPLVQKQMLESPILQEEVSLPKALPLDLSVMETKSLLSLVHGLDIVGEEDDSIVNEQKLIREDGFKSSVSVSVGAWVLCLLLLLFLGLVFVSPWQGDDDSGELVRKDIILNVDKSLSLDESFRTEESLVSEENKIVMKTLQSSSETPTSVGVSRKSTAIHSVVISSLPLGALVFIDGKAVGRTLIHNLSLKEGKHHIELQFGDRQIERTVFVNSNARFVWKPNAKNGAEEWSSFSP